MLPRFLAAGILFLAAIAAMENFAPAQVTPLPPVVDEGAAPPDYATPAFYPSDAGFPSGSANAPPLLPYASPSAVNPATSVEEGMNGRTLLFPPQTQLAPYSSDGGPLQAQPAMSPPFLSEPIVLPDEAPGMETELPAGARNGIFQKFTFLATWMPPLDDGLGFTDLAIGATFAFPFPTVASPLLVTPSFETHFVDVKNGPYIPSKLYDAQVDFRWIRPVGERWLADLSVAPGVHSDFQSSDAEAFRINGRGLGIYQWTPTAKLILGVLYLDRPKINVLPAGGIYWTPHDDVRYELVFPQPRIAWRMLDDRECGEEFWVYVSGEFGSGVWSIEQPGGSQTVMTETDYRVILGIEHKIADVISTRWEIGYVFGREIEYTDGTPTYNPPDTLLLRVGATY